MHGTYEKKEKDFYDAYLQAKQAFREDRRLDAQDILNKGFSDPTAQAFLPAGTLNITVGEEDALDYERALELDRGMASCGYTMGGSQIKSTCFASGVDNVLVYRICADTPRSFGVALNAQLKHTLREKDGILLLSGSTTKLIITLYHRRRRSHNHKLQLLRLVISNNMIQYRVRNHIILYINREIFRRIRTDNSLYFVLFYILI